MPTTTTDTAARAVTDYLSANPGPHPLEAIALAANVSKARAGKILKQLTESTPPQVRVDGADTGRTWTWILPGTQASPAAETAAKPGKGTTAGTPTPQAELAAAATAPDTAATGKAVDGAAEAPETDGTSTEPAAPDADQMVMHAARTLAAAKQPLSTAEIAAAGYVSASSLHLLTALRALAHQDLITCSSPFDPQSSECTWAWKGTDQAHLLDQAAKVQPTDAPDHVSCPECGTVKAIPGMPKNRKPGSNLRGNGTPKMESGQLGGLVRAFLEDPDNAGEIYKVNDVIRELRGLHGDRIAKHPYGSVSKAMAKLTEPPGKDQVALLILESEDPMTYRVRALP